MTEHQNTGSWKEIGSFPVSKMFGFRKGKHFKPLYNQFSRGSSNSQVPIDRCQNMPLSAFVFDCQEEAKKSFNIQKITVRNNGQMQMSRSLRLLSCTLHTLTCAPPHVCQGKWCRIVPWDIMQYYAHTTNKCWNIIVLFSLQYHLIQWWFSTKQANGGQLW